MTGQKLTSERGFSFVAVIIAVATAAIVLAIAMSTIDEGFQLVRFYSDHALADDVFGRMQTLLDNPAACKATIAGPSLSTTAVQISLKSPSGDDVFKVGDSFGQLSLTKISARYESVFDLTVINSLAIDVELKKESKVKMGSGTYTRRLFANVRKNAGTLECAEPFRTSCQIVTGHGDPAGPAFVISCPTGYKTTGCAMECRGTTRDYDFTPWDAYCVDDDTDCTGDRYLYARCCRIVR